MAQPEKEKMTDSFRSSFILGFILAVLLFTGVYFTGRDMVSANLANLDQVAVSISNRYVDKINQQDLTSAGIRGMLSILDPYSELLEAKAYTGLLEEAAGEFQGLGLEIAVKDGYLTVVSAISSTPAYRAGVMAGDKIVEIEGENVIGIKTEEAVKKLRGEKGTKVRIKVLRPGEVIPLDFAITREVIEIKPVPYYGMTPDHIGYITLKRFSEHASADVAIALRELKKQNAEGIILDLRGDPGGLLSQAVEVASLFLDGKKLVMETRGKDFQLNQKFYSRGDALWPTAPLVVLVDQGSASGSEIVAGAIQDWDRGVILGDTTYGKGMVQSVLELDQTLALKLTTAKYFTPSGRCIQKNHSEQSGELASTESAYIPKFAPDSSSDNQEYLTKGGRKVSGSGGIAPDVTVSGRQISQLQRQLFREGLFFDFAVIYLSTNPEVTLNFEVTEETFNQFLKFVKSKNFQYQSPSQAELEAVDGLSQEEFSSPSVQSALKGLHEQMSEEGTKLFYRLKEDLKWPIKEAILVNRFGERGRYEKVWFLLHPEISKAREVIKDRRLYQSLLSG